MLETPKNEQELLETPNEKDFAKWLTYSNNRKERLAVAAATMASHPQPPPEISWVSPPPIPTKFSGGEWVYGYVLTDEFMQAYFDAHPPEDPEPPRSSHLWRPFKIGAIFRVGLSLGLNVFFERLEEDVAYFSYTTHGNISRNVPAECHMGSFAKALGITEPARWYNTKVKLQDQM
ncbi:hypothetical protein DFH06DRAFT_1305794 [Mycena polygramma]|nr:hypothetical protein DFH06DRAFT_1305794 [Mycena polygramma]